MKKADVLIIGSGIAALQLATHIRSDLNVIILTKSQFKQSNSYKAQGGIACALGKNDHYHKHFEDTLEAGRHLHEEDAVHLLTSTAPDVLQPMISSNRSPFDRDRDGHLLLGREGAHSENRIVHGGGDQTGKRVIDFLQKQLKENVIVIENFFVYELLVDAASNTCYGVKGKHENEQVESIYADHVVIASGGASQIYAYTSNAKPATGDGYVLAYKAGAELIDMEFVQFHPTLLYVNGETKGLVSEAVRGEGATLVLENGSSIMKGVHPMEDLAPRHVVSQTIFQYIQKGEQVFLDISGIMSFKERFPTITNLCVQNGIDLSIGKIPVAPGSHFFMGGIKTDTIGRTNVNGLYAIGEAACTGVHGANRLASNSLLEGLVFGKRLAQFVNDFIKETPTKLGILPNRVTSSFTNQNIQLPALSEIQNSMMKNTGIVRSKQTLHEQLRWLEDYKIDKLLKIDLDRHSVETITKVFMLTTAWLITDSALKRTESRGGHFRSDYPYEVEGWKERRIIHIWNKEKGDSYEQIKALAIT